MAPTPPPKPAASLTDAELHQALSATLDRIVPVATAEALEYRFGGSASSRLRGVPMPVGDIDILLRERRGVDLFAAAVASLPGAVCHVAPFWEMPNRQYFARYLLDGVIVEFSTVEPDPPPTCDALECVGPGPWVHFDLLPFGAHRVPTVVLELRLVSDVTRNRPERYRPILAHLQEHGCDVALVRRGLAARRVPEDRQREVLDVLTGAPAR